MEDLHDSFNFLAKREKKNICWLNSAYLQQYLVGLQLRCLATLQGMLNLALCLLLCRARGKTGKMWGFPAIEGSAPWVQSRPFLQ